MEIFSWNLLDKAKLFNKCFACQYCLVKKQTKFTITFPTNDINPLSAIPTTWSNTLKQFVGNLPTNCLSMFDHFVILRLKG